MLTSEFPIPEGYSPPFAIVTDTDHTAWLLIAATLSLCMILLFGIIRVFIRWTVSPGLGLDDAFLLAATILAIIQSSVVISACSNGLGKAFNLISPELRTEVQELYYTSNLFFVLALGLSKLSVVFFLMRLTPARHHKRFFWAVAIFVGAWTFASLLAVAVQCDSAHPWILVGERCPGALLRWRVISAFDILIELAIVAMAVYLVWDLQAPFSTKGTVVGSFAMRLPIIVAIGFRIATFNERGYTTNPTLLEDLFIVWTQTELSYSIISATIPTLRPVMNNLNTQFGGLGPNTSAHGYGSAYGNSSGNYQMSNMRSMDKKSTTTQQGLNRSHMDPREHEYSYGVGSGRDAIKQAPARHGNGDATSLDSNDSAQMIIRKDTTYQVRYENAG